MEKKLDFKLKSNKIEELKSVVNDLGKINKLMKMKLDNDNFILYSVATAGEKTSGSNPSIIALKSFVFKSDHFFDIQQYDEDDELDIQVDYIIRNGSSLTKKINFIRTDVEVKGRFEVRKVQESNYARNMIISDGKFKFSLVGGEHTEVRDMSLDQLNQVTDESLSVTSFEIPTEEFLSSRSASQIDNDENITIHLNKGKIYFKQDNWELLVGNTEFDGNKKISFNKKYLKSINPKLETIRFVVFDRFILTKESDQLFMISYEQDFS